MSRYKQSLRLRARRAEREAEALASEMHWLVPHGGALCGPEGPPRLWRIGCAP
jgi:hypothetical protein